MAGLGGNSPADFAGAGRSLAGLGSSPVVGAGRRSSLPRRLAVVGSMRPRRGPGRGRRVVG